MTRTLAPLPLSLALSLSLALAACSQGQDGKGAAPGGSGDKAAAPPRTQTAATPAAPHEHAAHRSSPEAHADHSARHGGVVTMEGDNHVEIVVGPDGAIDLFVSDAVRTPIPPADVSGTLSIGAVGDKAAKQMLTLAADPKGSLSAKGPPPEQKADYTWSLKVRGTSMSMTITVPPGGTAKIGAAGDHAAGDHKHGSPHGGVVQTLGDGHAEVKIEKGGEVTLWLLDASEKPRSAKGATATLRPVVAGAEELKLDYDAKSDALRGKIAPPAAGPLDVLVTLKAEGGAATTARFKLQLEGGQGGHKGHEGH